MYASLQHRDSVKQAMSNTNDMNGMWRTRHIFQEEERICEVERKECSPEECSTERAPVHR